MRDLIGTDAMLQEKVEDTCKNSFKKYGFIPLYTPAVENFDLFRVKGGAGELIKDEIYYFKDKSDRELGLRFEFTASLARVAATNQLKMPFKRYQIGEVYRYDRPQAKRYRAFTQADIDILGIKSPYAELELMQITKDIFEKLELKPKVYFNSRVLLESLINKYSKGKVVETIRIIDKMDKVSEEETKKALENIDTKTEIIDIIKNNSIEEISELLGEDDAGVRDVKEFLELIKKNNLDFIEFNAGLARGLEYYTGIVFEAKIEDGPSIAGGGRFDKLISTYGGQDTPACGLGIGVSRIFDYLKEKETKVRVNGIYLIGTGVETDKLIEIATKLRESGIICEVDLQGKSISKNLSYAEKKKIRCVGIIGEDEIKENKITIKNMFNGMQFSIDLDTEKICKLFDE
jgi:histidyl-tRNA synthetase